MSIFGYICASYLKSDYILPPAMVISCGNQEIKRVHRILCVRIICKMHSVPSISWMFYEYSTSNYGYIFNVSILDTYGIID